MTVFNLLTFPNVCRACLQSLHPEQMIPLDTHRPLLDGDIGSFLEDIASRSSEQDVVPYLPTMVCFACVEVMEFFSKYRRKMRVLHEFLEALVHVKLDDETPLREMFNSSSQQLETLYRDLDLCNKPDAVVEDLLNEFNQYTIASMNVPSQKGVEVDWAEEQRSECGSSMLDFEEYSMQDTVVEEQCTPSASQGNQRTPNTTVRIRPLRKKPRLKIGPNCSPSKGTEEATLSASDVDVEGSEDPDGEEMMDKTVRKKIQCTECTYKSYYPAAVQVHVEKHRQNDGKQGFMCKNPFCLQLFATVEERNAHRKSSAHDRYVCDICGYVLKHRSSLEVHLERHVGNAQFQCTYCSSAFHTKTEMRVHMTYKHLHDDRVECQQCGSFFSSNKLLKQHAASHAVDRKFACPHCTSAFKTRHSLNRHIKGVHTDTRFECVHCNVSYSRRDKLRMHIENIHKIQTYFVCDICVQSFDTADGLKEHKYHHANPGELECGTCLRVCLTQESFDKHTCITYQDDYVCCGRDFMYHNIYNKHMMTHNIKVNARVKPKSDLLIGQERALRSFDRRFRTESKRKNESMAKEPMYNCVDCGQNFNSNVWQNLHTCDVLDEDCD